MTVTTISRRRKVWLATLVIAGALSVVGGDAGRDGQPASAAITNIGTNKNIDRSLAEGVGTHKGIDRAPATPMN